MKYFELHNRPKLFDQINRELIRNWHSPAVSTPGQGLFEHGRTAPGQREQYHTRPVPKGGYEHGGVPADDPGEDFTDAPLVYPADGSYLDPDFRCGL